jgi:hypothetical protein
MALEIKSYSNIGIFLVNKNYGFTIMWEEQEGNTPDEKCSTFLINLFHDLKHQRFVRCDSINKLVWFNPENIISIEITHIEITHEEK